MVCPCFPVEIEIRLLDSLANIQKNRNSFLLDPETPVSILQNAVYDNTRPTLAQVSLSAPAPRYTNRKRPVIAVVLWMIDQ